MHSCFSSRCIKTDKNNRKYDIFFTYVIIPKALKYKFICSILMLLRGLIFFQKYLNLNSESSTKVPFDVVVCSGLSPGRSGFKSSQFHFIFHLSFLTSLINHSKFIFIYIIYAHIVAPSVWFHVKFPILAPQRASERQCIYISCRPIHT